MAWFMAEFAFWKSVVAAVKSPLLISWTPLSMTVRASTSPSAVERRARIRGACVNNLLA